MSICSTLAFTCRASSGSAMPSTYNTSTGVRDCRPTICSSTFSSGARNRRRTRDVLVRTLSTKASLAPFTSGSFSGLDTDRFSSVPADRVSTLSFPGKNRATAPSIRSKITWSARSRLWTTREYSPPFSIRSKAASMSGAERSASFWVSGRST